MRFALFVLLLTACATQEEINAQRQREFTERAAQRAAYEQQLIAQCRAYGFADASPEFRNCLMQVDQANRHRDAQTRSVILQQLLQEEAAGRERALPLCSSLAPGMAGYYRAQGRCR